MSTARVHNSNSDTPCTLICQNADLIRIEDGEGRAITLTGAKWMEVYDRWKAVHEYSPGISILTKMMKDKRLKKAFKKGR